MKNLSIIIAFACASAFAQAQVSLSTTVLDFGLQLETTADSQAVWVKNQSDEAITVSNIYILQNEYGSPFSLGVTPTNIPAKDSFQIWVRSNIRHNIDFDSELVIKTTGSSSSLVVDLRASGSYSNNYYSSTRNKSEEALKTELKSVITAGYNSLSYAAARDAMFMTFDNQRTNGQGATVNTLECVYTGTVKTGYTSRSNAQTTSPNFNTEHTFPQGQFNSASPMKTDIHHLFPTTNTSNSQRGNLPFSTVGTASWQQGGSKKSSSAFEPRDSHKGDAARSLLYFVMKYQDYNGFLAPQESILRTWSNQDLPDAKERRRNDDIFGIQNNRSPLVDYPQFLERISSVTGTASSNFAETVTIWDQVLAFDTIVRDSSSALYSLVTLEGDEDLVLNNFRSTSTSFKFDVLFDTASQFLDKGDDIKILVQFHPQDTGELTGQILFDNNGTTETVDLIGYATGEGNAGSSGGDEASVVNDWLTVYPNPAKSKVWVKSDFKGTYTLTDQMGRAVNTGAIDEGKNKLKVELATGIYQLMVNTAEYRSTTAVIIK